jgi:hypothetical protein
VQNKGWDKLDPAAAAATIARAHREAEKHFGVPADQLLRMPKADAPEAEVKAFWNKLGVPADATGYKFEGVEENVAELAREIALANNIPVSQAQGLARHLAAFAEKEIAETDAQAAQQLQQQRDELQRNWGAQHSTNLEVARRGAAKLGFDADTFAALENSAGYAKVMEAMRQVGVAAGEAKFFEGDAGAGTGTGGQSMTRDQAVARIESLKGDREWGKRWMAGGTAEIREWEDLHRLAIQRNR